MIINTAFKTNWNQIQEQNQDIIDNNDWKEDKNKSQIPYENKVGDQVLLEIPRILPKFSTPYKGTYPVTNVQKNGTIRM
jgi:hypothetical protein